MTRLKVSNEDFLVASLIDRCPSTMMLRELVMNAIEASNKSKEKLIKIRVAKWNNTEKLSIWNSGPGMSDSELRKACDMSSSVDKIQSLDENFGMGAKVSSLKANKLGMRYRSNKNGNVSEVVMGQEIDPVTRKGIYMRIDYPDSNTNWPDVLNVTKEVKEEGIDISSDWTEVVLFGNSEKQNTVKDPFEGNPSVPKRWIGNMLYQRFFSLPEGLKITLEDGTNQRGGNRNFEPFHSKLVRLSKEFKEHVSHESVETEEGLKINYYFDGADTGGHSYSYRGNVASDIAFCGIVYKDEIYDHRGSNSWYVTSAKLGIPFGQRYISVTVELPDSTPVIPDGYRETIKWNDYAKQDVKIEEYASIVRDNIPEWLQKKIDEFSPKKSTSEDIEEKLKELLKNLNVITKTLTSSQEGKGANNSGETKVHHIREGAKRNRETNIKSPNRPLTEIQGTHNALRKQGVQIPQFISIYTEEQLKTHPDLAGRAAKYVRETNTIYLNMIYPQIEMMKILLKKEFVSQGSSEEEVDDEISLAVEDNFKLKLGSAVVFALSKKGNDDWSFEDQEDAWSEESLSIVADFWQDDLKEVRARLNRSFKRLSA